MPASCLHWRPPHPTRMAQIMSVTEELFIDLPPPVDAFLPHGEGPQDGVHPALGGDGSGSGDGAYGEEIGMIRMGN